MINFHKFGFLDAKKLQRYITNKNYWLCQYNPVWIFIWSDYYKPEIAYDNEFCFIRFLLPDVGMCYYPPLGEGSLEKGMNIIKADARDNGFDFNIAPICEDFVYNLRLLKYDIKETEIFDNLIYSCEEISFSKGNRALRSKLKKFSKEHPNAYYKEIKKDDFPQILEFIEKWHQENIDIKSKLYYSKLNAIKQMIDHLYELDLFGIILLDESGIYGVSIASVVDNVCFLHLSISLSDVVGAVEQNFISFAKTALLYARYINVEKDSSSKDINQLRDSFQPFKHEKYYSTFRL